MKSYVVYPADEADAVIAELVELLEEHREHIVAGLTAYSLIAATADLKIQRAEASIKAQEIQAHLRKLDEAINKHKQGE